MRRTNRVWRQALSPVCASGSWASFRIKPFFLARRQFFIAPATDSAMVSSSFHGDGASAVLAFLREFLFNARPIKTQRSALSIRGVFSIQNDILILKTQKASVRDGDSVFRFPSPLEASKSPPVAIHPARICRSGAKTYPWYDRGWGGPTPRGGRLPQ